MKIKEVKMTPDLLKVYKSQKNIRRNREVKSGYEAIIVASDQDLD